MQDWSTVYFLLNFNERDILEIGIKPNLSELKHVKPNLTELKHE